MQRGQRQSEHGGVAPIASAPGLVFPCGPPIPRPGGMRSSKTSSCWKVNGRSLFARIAHGSGTQSFFVSVVYCQQRRAPGADVTNRSILDAVALGEVPVIIVGDVQGNPAEQSDQMSGALRRGWLVDGGWEHRPQPPGCPAPTFISGQRPALNLSSRIGLLPACFASSGWVETLGSQSTVQSSLFELETRPFSSCNEESVPVLRWMLQKGKFC